MIIMLKIPLVGMTKLLGWNKSSVGFFMLVWHHSISSFKSTTRRVNSNLIFILIPRYSRHVLDRTQVEWLIILANFSNFRLLVLPTQKVTDCDSNALEKIRSNRPYASSYWHLELDYLYFLRWMHKYWQWKCTRKDSNK